MASDVDARKFRRKFAKLEKDPALAALAIAVMQKPLRDGLAQEFERRQASVWKPNSEEWRNKKLGIWGGSGGPLERTGETKRAMINNAPVKLGTKRKMKVGMNWRSHVAYAAPTSFTDARGKKKLPAKQQQDVLRLLRYGSSIAKLRNHAEKKKRNFEDVLDSSFGPKTALRERALGGYQGVPARPFLFWEASWSPDIEKDVDAAIVKLLKDEGILARLGLRG